MSFQALRWAFEEERGVGGTTRYVLLELADHANKHNEAWPSVERLAERTGVGRTSVKDALVELEERGLIASVGSRQRARLRRLLITPTDDAAAARARALRAGGESR